MSAVPPSPLRPLMPSAVLLFLAGCATGGGDAVPLEGPFFQEERPADVTLETDFEAIREERFADGEPGFHPGTLRYRGPNGARRELPVRIRRRGDSRRYVCDVPALLVEVPEPADDPVFGDARRLHHVSHCLDREPGAEALPVTEYAAYRLYELLAPEALRARLVRVRYRERSGEGGGADGDPRWALVVEDRARLSDRTGGEWVDDRARVDPDRIDGERAALVALFQQMIGNTDWGVPTLHNVMLLRTDGGTLIPIPFDFDFSGLVDAPYARPDPRWGLASVRERIFLGCTWEEHLPGAVEQLRRRAPEILRVLGGLPGLAPETRAEAVAYVEPFLEELAAPDAVERLAGECRRRSRPDA